MITPKQITPKLWPRLAHKIGNAFQLWLDRTGNIYRNIWKADRWDNLGFKQFRIDLLDVLRSFGLLVLQLLLRLVHIPFGWLIALGYVAVNWKHIVSHKIKRQ
jgi:hypothetical protein